MGSASMTAISSMVSQASVDASILRRPVFLWSGVRE